MREQARPERGLRETLVRPGASSPVVPFVGDYLTRFGYTRPCACPDDRLCPHLGTALARYQSFTGLTVAATLTLETLKLMRQPRCPVPDFDPDELGGPGVTDQDPFVFTPGTWANPMLRWFLDGGTSDVTAEADAVQRAFDTWTAHIPLTVTRTFVRADADLVVDWVVGDHGDGSPFDGAGNILAHAFFPSDGRIHFDESETWSHSGTRDVETVALHEVGHALGLRHSGSSDAAMFFQINNEQRTLHEFDVRGIRSRYPPVVHRHTSDVVTVPLWGLKNSGGTGTVTVDLGRPRRILAWGQITMADSLNDLDRDNAYAVEVFDVDGDRPAGFVSGGAHWGSVEAPSNVYSGAFVGRGQRVTFRISALHTADLDVFGTGTIIVLD